MSLKIIYKYPTFISDSGKVRCSRYTVEFKAIVGSVSRRHVLASYRQTEDVDDTGGTLYRYLYV